MTVPQLMSISSLIFLNIAVLVANFKLGTGLQPKHDPRPVVKQITLAPEATWPVTETGS